MSTIPSPATTYKATRNPRIIMAVGKLERSRKHLEDIRPRIYAIHREVIKAGGYTYDDYGTRKPFDFNAYLMGCDYLMDDAQYQRYNAAVTSRIQASKYAITDRPDACPLRVAEVNVGDDMRELADIWGEVTGTFNADDLLSIEKGVEALEEFCDILIGLVRTRP